LQVAWHEIPYIMPIRRTGKSGTDGGRTFQSNGISLLEIFEYSVHGC
jgi:hypothetical protein